MEEFKNIGGLGWYKNNGSTVATFQMGEGMPMSIDTEYDSINMNQASMAPRPLLLSVGPSRVLIKGSNNLLPDEIKFMFANNRLLPELIDKQFRILQGKGLHVYRQVFEDKKLYRDWQHNETIENWAGDWQSNGLPDSIETYADKVSKDSYYFEDYWSKWRFFKSRRIGGMPVAGLEHIENRRGRLGTSKNIDIFSMDYVDSDFDQVVVGNWGTAFEKGMKVYPRFSMANASDYAAAVSYNKHHMPGEIYGMNKFYFGIKEWLTATNRNPKYINSYLENSLSAKVHVIIPQEWVAFIQDQIEGYCEENRKLEAAGSALLTFKDVEVGTEYHAALLDAVIKAEMRNLTKFMTGVKNQGKTWTTFKYTTDKGDSVGWEIIPLDMKYREYVTALNDYDKRADEVITSSIGIDSSISNISKDGVISKSGADAYYNYIIYLQTNLPAAERMVTADLNNAIKLNFPALHKQGYRLGFYTEIPARQEDISPGDRLTNQMNQTTQQVNNRLDKTDAMLTQILQKLSR